MDVLNSIWLYYLDLDFSYRFVSAIITFLVIFSLLLFAGILLSRTIKNRNEKKANYWHGIFQEILVQILFEPDYARGGSKYKEIVLKYKASKLDGVGRKTLIDEMLELHKGVKGDSAIAIEQLYRDFGLVKYQVDFINRGQWWEKAFAFRVFSEFGIVEEVDLIKKYVDHPNRVLRSEAQYAVVSLSGAAGLYFVPKLKSPISEWEQLVLLEKLYKFRPEDLPNVGPWLDSKNNSVVIFGTKIIHQFRMFQLQEKLLDLLIHKNELVVSQVVTCIVRIEYKEACPKLKEIYPNVDLVIKAQILTALAKLGDRTNLNFFQDVIEEQEEYELVMASAKGLKILKADALLLSLERKELKFPKNNEIVRHALDERI
ncbi:MAG: HEAT repeat domain-containing protein [Salibacteraceae bacterium]